MATIFSISRKRIEMIILSKTFLQYQLFKQPVFNFTMIQLLQSAFTFCLNAVLRSEETLLSAALARRKFIETLDAGTVRSVMVFLLDLNCKNEFSEPSSSSRKTKESHGYVLLQLRDSLKMHSQPLRASR